MKTQAIKARRDLVGSSRLSIPRSVAYALHMTGMRRVSTDGDNCVSRVSRGYGIPGRHPRNILFYETVLYDTHFLYPHYIYPYYPQMLRSPSERNP